MGTKTDIEASFDAARIGPFSFTIDGVTGSYTTGRYWHRNVSTVDTGGLGALCTALTTSLAGGTHTVAVTFSAANLTYTLTGTGNFDLTTISAPLNQILGKPTFGGAIGGATTGKSAYSSSMRPQFAYRSLVAGQSSVSDEYEPDGLIKGSVADDGLSFYSIGPLALPKYLDFTIPYEVDAPLLNGGTFSGGSGHATFTRNATQTMPYAWEDLWQSIRAQQQFAWIDQTSPPSAAVADVMVLRPEGANWKPMRATPDFGMWSLMFRTLLLGRQ